jgi:DNA replication protein DnaC
MNALPIERLGAHLQRLRLLKSRERLEALLHGAVAKEASYADFLESVLAEEVNAKTARNLAMRTRLARFPHLGGPGP